MAASTTKLVPDFRSAASTEKPKAKNSYGSIQPPRLYLKLKVRWQE
jgi:hypothetical protein